MSKSALQSTGQKHVWDEREESTTTTQKSNDLFSEEALLMPAQAYGLSFPERQYIRISEGAGKNRWKALLESSEYCRTLALFKLRIESEEFKKDVIFFCKFLFPC